MMTIKICENVTATLTLKKLGEYWHAQEASKNLRFAAEDEDLDWKDYEDYEIEARKAWEKFCS